MHSVSLKERGKKMIKAIVLSGGIKVVFSSV